MLSRPVFRTCEVLCNHLARLAARGNTLSDGRARSALGLLERRRAMLQDLLGEIGSAHAHACADCLGRCCWGPRERDAFIDRILQDPSTGHRGARGPKRIASTCAHAGKPCCPELTPSGCRLPYSARPIQCTAYFCSSAAASLSDREQGACITALLGLMGVQLRTVLTLIRLRFAQRQYGEHPAA